MCDLAFSSPTRTYGLHGPFRGDLHSVVHELDNQNVVDVNWKRKFGRVRLETSVVIVAPHLRIHL